MCQRLRIAVLFCSIYGTLVLGSLAGDAYKQIMRLAEIAAEPQILAQPEFVIENADYRERIQRCVEVARQLAEEISSTQIDIPALDDRGRNRASVVARLVAVAWSLQCREDDYTAKLILNGLNILRLILSRLPQNALDEFRVPQTSLNRRRVRLLIVKDLRSSIRATLDTMIGELPIPPQKPAFGDNYDVTANHSEEIQTQINMAVGLAKDAFPHLDIQVQVPQFIELSRISRQKLNAKLLEIGLRLKNTGAVLGTKLWKVLEPLGLIVTGRFHGAQSNLNLDLSNED
jgi:hypothetical protein